LFNTEVGLWSNRRNFDAEDDFAEKATEFLLNYEMHWFI